MGMWIVKFLLIWIGAVVILCVTVPTTPNKYYLLSRKSPLFWWMWSLAGIAIFYLSVGMMQLIAGCRFLGECYSSELPDSFHVLKISLAVSANIWIFAVSVRAVIIFGRKAARYVRTAVGYRK